MSYISVVIIFGLCLSTSFAGYGTDFKPQEQKKSTYDTPKLKLNEPRIHLDSPKIILNRPTINVHEPSSLHEGGPVIIAHDKSQNTGRNFQGITNGQVAGQYAGQVATGAGPYAAQQHPAAGPYGSQAGPYGAQAGPYGPQAGPYGAQAGPAVSPYSVQLGPVAGPYGAQPGHVAGPYGAQPGPYGTQSGPALGQHGAQPGPVAGPYGAQPSPAAGPYGGQPAPYPIFIDNGYNQGPIQVFNPAPIPQERQILIHRPIVVQTSGAGPQDHLENVHYSQSGFIPSGRYSQGGFTFPVSRSFNGRTAVRGGPANGFGPYNAPFLVQQPNVLFLGQPRTYGQSDIDIIADVAVHGHGGHLNSASLKKY